MKKITIVDTQSGNILSIKRAFEKCDAEVEISNEKEKILKASRLVLPGVGAFNNTITKLKSMKLLDIFNDDKLKNKPLLGICLGMQLFFDESEEFGTHKGLRLIGGRVIKLPDLSLKKKELKIPSIGWRKLILTKTTSNLMKDLFFKNFREDNKFYFVHSYYVVPNNNDLILANYAYGDFLIPAVVGKDNIIGCQFHPEKSGPSGLNLIKNFISI